MKSLEEFLEKIPGEIARANPQRNSWRIFLYKFSGKNLEGTSGDVWRNFIIESQEELLIQSLDGILVLFKIPGNIPGEIP